MLEIFLIALECPINLNFGKIFIEPFVPQEKPQEKSGAGKQTETKLTCLNFLMDPNSKLNRHGEKSRSQRNQWTMFSQ